MRIEDQKDNNQDTEHMVDYTYKQNIYKCKIIKKPFLILENLLRIAFLDIVYILL